MRRARIKRNAPESSTLPTLSCSSTLTASPGTVSNTADRKAKVTVQLDAEMVERARAEIGLDSGTDTAVVERALNAYLMGRLLDVTQAGAGLPDDDDDDAGLAMRSYTLRAVRAALRDPGCRRPWRLHLGAHREAGERSGCRRPRDR